MRKYITSELNRTVHRIKGMTKLDWNDAFDLALRLSGLPTQEMLAPWSFESTLALAGHYRGLAKAYEEVGDKGRSIAMSNVARLLYEEVTQARTVSLQSLSREKGVGQSTLFEAFDFFVASHTHSLTPRSLEVISKGATEYKRHLRLPMW